MSRFQFLDVDDPAPQVLFHKTHLVAHDGLPNIEHEPAIIRFRSLDDALFALRHNERVPQFARMGNPDFPPFLCWGGTIKKAWRFLTDNAMARRVPRYGPDYPEH